MMIRRQLLSGESFCVRVPSSKSMANRVLVMSSLAATSLSRDAGHLSLAGESRKSFLRGDFEAEDIQLLLEGLKVLGVKIEQMEGRNEIASSLTRCCGVAHRNDRRELGRLLRCPEYRRQGGAGGTSPATLSAVLPAGRRNDNACLMVSGGDWLEEKEEVCLHLGNAGTAMRFLVAVSCLRRGATILDGAERMRERPIGDLVDAVRLLGVRVEYLGVEGFPPIRVEGRATAFARTVTVKADVSSQFLSALLMLAPLLQDGLEVLVDGKRVSRPYVDMTVGLMRSWGVEVVEKADSFRIPSMGYKAQEFEVEGDASGASYWFCMAALLGVKVTVSNVFKGSLQGDVKFVEVLKRMGCGVEYGDFGVTVVGPERLKGIELDMNDMPDMVMGLSVCAAVADGSTVITNIGSLRVKETDRIAAICTELRKLGVMVEEGEDWLRIVGKLGLKMEEVVEIETYDDHRMAMSFGVLGLRVGNLNILNEGCVAKSYPGFWDEMNSFPGFVQ